MKENMRRSRFRKGIDRHRGISFLRILKRDNDAGLNAIEIKEADFPILHF